MWGIRGTDYFNKNSIILIISRIVFVLLSCVRSECRFGTALWNIMDIVICVFVHAMDMVHTGPL